jgi:hypothetical protein
VDSPEIRIKPLALSHQELSLFLRNENSTTWDSRPGCPKAGRMPALQEMDVIKSSFLRGEIQDAGQIRPIPPGQQQGYPTEAR